MERFDVIVIGTGVAGQTAAQELARAGRSVAITDSREYGGTCALRGCEAKKVLFTAAEVVERARRQGGSGLAGAPRLDWPSLIAFKRSFTAPVPESVEASLGRDGITLLHGRARFVAPDAIEIGDARYAAERFIVATGAVPRPLGIPGEERVLDSEAFMELDRLGDRVVFIGGGYVSFEFAHIAAAAGADVTILHRGQRVLEAFDADLTDMLVAAYRGVGIHVLTGVEVTGVRVDGAALTVLCAQGPEVHADVVVHGAGRIPAVADLGLEAAEVAYGSRGIEVDRSMRSVGNERVYAVGDVASRGVPLTPVAIAQARVAVADLLDPGSEEFAPRVVPSVVFSDPVLASAGMTGEQAQAHGANVEVRLTDTGEWASSRRAGRRISGGKTVVERGSGRILGVHLLGEGAADVIDVCAAAIGCGLTVSEFKRRIWTYPTGVSDLTYLF